LTKNRENYVQALENVNRH